MKGKIKRTESRLASVALQHLKAEHVNVALEKFALATNAKYSAKRIAGITPEETDAMAAKFFAKHATKNPDQAAVPPSVEETAAKLGLVWK